METIEAVVVLGGVLATWAGVGTQMYLSRSNRKKLNADANSEDASAIESYANATRTYAEEVKNLRTEVAELRNSLDERDAVIREQATHIEDLKDWADRLVHQVKSYGATPVPFRQRKVVDKQE